MEKKFEVKYPETLPDFLQENEDVFEFEAKMAMAVKLFELKRISSGTAAELVGIDRVSFLKELKKYKVSFINIDPNELASDIENV